MEMGSGETGSVFVFETRDIPKFNQVEMQRVAIEIRRCFSDAYIINTASIGLSA